MTDTATLNSIEHDLVDQVVTGAMLLLAETEDCRCTTAVAHHRDDVTVAVYCDADQQSAVILRCTQRLAITLASQMLELTPDEVCEVDLLDATGELVNVIAGNLRGLVASPGSMSPPFTLQPDEYARFAHAQRNSYHVTGEGMEVLRV